MPAAADSRLLPHLITVFLYLISVYLVPTSIYMVLFILQAKPSIVQPVFSLLVPVELQEFQRGLDSRSSQPSPDLS